MDFPKYGGDIHPDEWIKDIQSLFKFRKLGKQKEPRYDYDSNELDFAVSLVDSFIELPDIGDYEGLRKALKEDISFTVFKNANKRKLQSLNYIPERKDGDTSKFISEFRKLCYNAEIDDIEEQKTYLYQSLPDKKYYNEADFLNKNFNSIDELLEEFEEIVTEGTNLIRDGSIVALKHVATGKYLSSIENLHYTTGRKDQLVFVGGSKLDQNSRWKVDYGESTHTDNKISLKHVKSDKYLGLCYDYDPYKYYAHYESGHTEVSCIPYGFLNWKYNISRSERHQGYLKSNDVINFSVRIKKGNDNDQCKFLRSHDIQFTIENDTFQEVICHSEELGGDDEWRIELIKQAKYNPPNWFFR